MPASRCNPSSLSEQDRQELHDSSIDDATIERFAPFTETDGAAVARLLNRHHPYPEDMNGGLVYPIFGADGIPYENYAQIKLHTPRHSTDGKPIKYEIPVGTHYRIGFSPDSARTLDVTVPLVIVEGVKKGMGLSSLGYAVCILLGVDCWAEPGEAEERPLHSDFDSVPLEGRTVVIIFDKDPQRNPNVERACCRLAQRLVERGADVKIMSLPSEKNEQGESLKVGVDDFIHRHGAEEFNRLFRELIESPSQIPTDEYRVAMNEANLAASLEPGIYSVCGPTGSGKSYSLRHTLRSNRASALISQPTHQQNDELLRFGREIDIMMHAYPAVTSRTCRNYEEVNRGAQIGIQRRTVCIGCHWSATCSLFNHAPLAASAIVSLCTHARFGLSHSTRDGKRQIHIHEDIASLLAPTTQLTGDFRILRSIVESVRDRCHAAEDIVQYCDQLLRTIRIAISCCAAMETTVHAPPRIRRAKQPDGFEEELYREIVARNVAESIGNTFLFCQRVMQGRVRNIVVHCDAVRGNFRKSISVHLKSSIPRRSRRIAYLLYDATLNHSTAENLLGGRIIDITPPGRLQPVHRIVQYPDADIKRGTSPRRLLQILQSLLFLRYPNARRVGIICHANHREQILAFKNSLPPEQRRRIVIVEHFHGSVSRGSNQFQQANLDVLFILGTPRVPKPVIRDRVIQSNDFFYFDSDWGGEHWGGFTESGSYRIVSTQSYLDHDWHKAQNEIVASELVQAIGRARILNADGIPLTVLLSNFNTGLGPEDGLYLAEDDLPKITRTALRDVLRVATALYCPPIDADGDGSLAADPLRPPFSINIIQRMVVLASETGEQEASRGDGCPTFSRMTTTQLAASWGIAKSTTTKKLGILERLGLIHKVRARCGYTVTAENWSRICLICRTSMSTETQEPQVENTDHQRISS